MRQAEQRADVDLWLRDKPRDVVEIALMILDGMTLEEVAVMVGRDVDWVVGRLRCT